MLRHRFSIALLLLAAVAGAQGAAAAPVPVRDPASGVVSRLSSASQDDRLAEGLAVDWDLTTPGSPASAVQRGSERLLRASRPTDSSVKKPAPVVVRGQHKVIVVPLYWRSPWPPPGEPTSAKFSTLVQDLDSYYRTLTQGRVTVKAAKILPWMKTAVPEKGICDEGTFAAVQRIAMKAAGKVPADGLHHVVAYFPILGNCRPMLAMATTPKSPNSPFIWLNGDATPETLQHEFAHNLGADHSGALICPISGTSKLQTWAPSCYRRTYDDPWDVMGNSSFAGHMGIGHLYRLGLLGAGTMATVRGAQTVRLSPLAGTAGTRGAMFHVGTKTFFAEYRTPIGLDSWIDDEGIRATDGYMQTFAPLGGVVVREMDSAAKPSWQQQEQDVIDFHPDGAIYGNHRRALQQGETYRAPRGLWSIRVLTADASGATVNITAPAR